MNHYTEKPGTHWPHPDLLLGVPPLRGNASAEEEDLESSQLCCVVGVVQSGYSRTERVNLSVNANAQSGLIICIESQTYSAEQKSVFTMTSQCVPHARPQMTEIVLM